MSERLDLLRPLLGRFSRKFSVLDLGSGVNIPTLGWEIAQEFDAVVVEVEKDWKPVESIGKSTIVLKHEFTVADLAKLSECEHFDVVIAFNFIHWFESGWHQAAEAILNMGDYVFVQIPTEADSVDAPGYVYVEAMQGYFKDQCDWLGSTSQFPGHTPRPIYMHGNGVKRLTRTSLEAHDNSANIVIYSTHHDIQASFHHKTPREFRPWIPGTNLWNFCKLGGVVPSPAKIQEMLCSLVLPEKQHGDVQPWNMILDGERLHLIDEAPGKVHESFDSDAEQLAATIRKVEEALSGQAV